ncbi:MAG: electron transfer flavoprotein subunit beta/FixA family protein [Deltaproteobacteria bacterium]|nr:electron transfer flavoprotein subunit beta/FixA family protein [Deltaproteobacteria bacterium]MBI3296416.1 electron transfer flavoprotein subunit beta/FixA family protein [Deltaproteobacteria bacterium]
MNIFVCIKQVPDTETKIRIKGDKSGIETNDVKWIVSPYDEFAIEEALRAKAFLKTGTVTVVTVGPDRAVEALRTGLAMGADTAVHVRWETSCNVSIAKAVAEVVKKENGSVIFSGKQAIDDDQGVVFAYTAELLNWPSTSTVSKVEFGTDGKSVTVEKEVDGSARHKIAMNTPCVIAMTKGINAPRYASLPGIMAAKKKTVKVYSPSDLGLSDSPLLKDFDYELPPERKAGIKLSGEIPAQVAELVKRLREEAKVI